MLHSISACPFSASSIQLKQMSVHTPHHSINSPNLEHLKSRSRIDNICIDSKRMAGWLKVLFLVCFLVIAGVGSVKGKGVCGTLSPDQEAVQLVPCAAAARDGKAPVSKSCCLQVKRIGQNPRCLCAVLLSNAAKAAGVKPQVAISIPKRCGFTHRPVGYKCGRK